MISRRFWWYFAWAVLGALVIFVLPFVMGDTHQFRFSYVAAYFIAALGLQILTGYTGQISLGQSGFMLIGAYTTMILSVDHGWRDVYTIPLAGVTAGIAGFLFGFPALRLRGVYLALATFAIPIALIALVRKYDGFTHGGGGQAMTRVPTGHEAYVLSWPIAGIMAFHAVRADEGDAFVAAGVESITQVNGYPKSEEELHPALFGDDAPIANVYIPMGLTAENVAEQWDVSREDMPPM